MKQPAAGGDLLITGIHVDVDLGHHSRHLRKFTSEEDLSQSHLSRDHPGKYFAGGFSPTPLKNDGVKVSWDDDIPN
jgi:hypothetical protein